MIIGIDADGVLTDMAGFNCKYGEIFFKRKPVDPFAYKTGDMFGVGHSQEILFGTRYFYEYCCKLQPREDAQEVNRQLSDDSHQLYAITARKYAVQHNPLGWLSRHLFTGWLKKNELRFEDILFCTESNTPAEKLDYCKRISAEIMIDDNPEVALFLARNGMTVLLFDAPYNKDIAHEKIIRVYGWKEIYKYVIQT
ncbi:MAG: hypothetical protein Q4F95_02380 [Oscillospiraceae bacterium]|nr:hypothetical protein [Oscillospiraceae bacterium]